MIHRWLTLFPAAGLSLCATVATAAPVTYLLKDWGVHSALTHLQGSITVDDADGNRLIQPSEILDWSFTGTTISRGPSGNSLQAFNLLREPGAQVVCAASGCFELHGLDLALNIETQGVTQFADSAGNFLDVSGDTGFGGDAVARDRVATLRWRSGNSAESSTLGMALDPLMRIATVGAVPEPSTTALLLAALVAAASAAGVQRRSNQEA